MDYTKLNERVITAEQFEIMKTEKSASYCKPFKHSRNNMLCATHPAIFKAEFCPQTVFMCFVRLPEQTEFTCLTSDLKAG